MSMFLSFKSISFFLGLSFSLRHFFFNIYILLAIFLCLNPTGCSFVFHNSFHFFLQSFFSQFCIENFQIFSHFLRILLHCQNVLTLFLTMQTAKLNSSFVKIYTNKSNSSVVKILTFCFELLKKLFYLPKMFRK